MINDKKILAIIPARGGSKGVHRKNIKILQGKPLIAYTIEEALKSKYIDRVVVSTEDEEIASISKEYKAEVPFMRPKRLAKDTTPGIEPVLYCIDELEKRENYQPEYICQLQCTSPFRKIEQIDEAIEKIATNKSDSIISVCESEITPYWMKRIEKGVLKDFLKDAPFYARRQDAPKVYRLNGAIYIAKRKALLKNKSFSSDSTLPYIMDRITSLDIDDILDFKFAEFMMKEIRKSEHY